MTLEPPDSHHLSAAVGWLELGNSIEALNELERITPTRRNHPNVLEVRWSIFAARHQWESCVNVAKELTQLAPKEPFGWIHLSFALHELKRTREAYENLKSVLPSFPQEWLMRYNMACYACQLGSMQEAEAWLADAILKNGDAKAIRAMASDDPDLKPLFQKSK